MANKIKVGLVYGGKSGEHDVSLQTALAVIQAFDFSEYEITPFYITAQGDWRKGTPLEGPVTDKEVLKLQDGSSENSTSLQALFHGEDQLDVIFPLLHGTYGEDGTIQGLLEMADIPYVGAGVLASAVGMDKVMMKKIFEQADLPQCEYRYFTARQWGRDESFFIMEIEIGLGYPCFVKPANLGSSVGISKANNRQELIDAVNGALRYDRKIIVEQFVNAREIEVAVLGNDDPIASVAGEIVSSNEFYDYKAKYIDGKSAMIIPAQDITEEQAEEIRDMAISAFQAIDASGLSRCDFFLSRDDSAIYINEINTMPGFTPHSMYPLLWKESGKPYQELLDNLIQLALDRYNEKQSIQYNFDT